jgi:hypothetical protein
MEPSTNRETRIKKLANQLLTSHKLFSEQTKDVVVVDGFDSPVPGRLRLNVNTEHEWLDHDIAIRLVMRAASLYVPKEVRAPEPDSSPLLLLPTPEFLCRLDEGSDGIIDDESYEFRLTLALEIAQTPLQLLENGLSKAQTKRLKKAETQLIEVLNGFWLNETPEVGGGSKGKGGRGDWSSALSEVAADALRDQASRGKDASSEVTGNEIALLTDRLMDALGVTDRANVESLKTALRRARRAAAKRAKP